LDFFVPNAGYKTKCVQRAAQVVEDVMKRLVAALQNRSRSGER
jgi:hypothetical protein